jgi:hypothetical protein
VSLAPAADPHETRSDLERTICEELAAQGLSHEHRSLHFRVRDASGALLGYDPTLVVRRGPIVFLVEAVTEATDASRIALMARFLEQHSPDLVLVVLARRAVLETLPAEAYDERYDAADVPRAVRRIREQDPEGIVEPFLKDRAA